jgi:hypothetical protein
VNSLEEAFLHHDSAHLSQLTPDERAIQVQVRWKLYEHIDQIWDAPHLRSKGIQPNEAGGYDGVAAMRDLLMGLWANAQEAQHAAGDEVDEVNVDMVVKRNEG